MRSQRHNISPVRAIPVSAAAVVMLLWVFAATSIAQQINFSLSVQDGILATPVQDLNFNVPGDGAPVKNGETVTVNIVTSNEHALGFIEIFAAKDYEIDLEMSFDTVLRPPNARFDQIQTIPVTYYWAYSNNNEPCNSDAITGSTHVPEGFTYARIPVKKHTASNPVVPPPPLHGGNINTEGDLKRPASRVCIIVGGEIKVPNVPSDTYESDVIVTIRYSEPLDS